MRDRHKTRPARHKTPIFGHFSCAGRILSRSHPPSDQAGRTFSRTGHSHVATVKPPSPLQPLMQANVKPPSPLQPKNAPKTAFSHPQRRWRFQPHTHTSEQRRCRFHARDFQCPRAMAGPGRTSRRRTEPHISDTVPPVWRAPEGPEGTGGLRGAGPGCGARGRRQGLAGLRDRPLRAAGSRVAISRAGRRPPAHTAARHNQATRRQQHQRPGKPALTLRRRARGVPCS